MVSHVRNSELWNFSFLWSSSFSFLYSPGNSVVDYFNYMINRVTVKFALLEEPSEIKFELDLMKNMTYVDVVNAIGEKIGHHPENIRLTSHST